MNLPRGSLGAFLTTAKSTLQNAIINQQRVTIVIGNESADLDSIISAVLLAYLRSASSPSPLTNTSINRHTPPSQYPPFYIPVVNVSAIDLKIRPELLALLPHANLQQSQLITLDDLNAEPPAGLDPTGKETLQPQFTRLVLVDHNRLDGPLSEKGFDSQVVGCIDHHVDEHFVPSTTGNEPRIVEKSGSCSSLILQYCRPAWDALSDSAFPNGRAAAGQSDEAIGSNADAMLRSWDAQVARLAIASILIDTNNLKDETKTMDVDRQAVSYLEGKISLAAHREGPKWDRDAFFEEIRDAKNDLGHLTPNEILRKDYKEWLAGKSHLGISSVVQSLSWLIEKAGGLEGFADTMARFAAGKKVEFYAIMTAFTSKKGVFQRELLFWSANRDDSVIQRVEQMGKEQLGLEIWDDESNKNIDVKGEGATKVWWLKETQNSRKQVAPLIRKIIESL